MITKEEYLKAKETVAEYEKQFELQNVSKSFIMDIEKEFEELKKLIENAWASGYTVDLRTALERLERIRKEIGV